MNDGADSPFVVLLVCTGNICRSPVGERLLAAVMPAPVVVRSAGTRALVGEPISPLMVPLLYAAGAGSEDFSARRLTAEMVRDADLVLAMTRSHRREVVELWPGAVRRSFTLLEFALLLQKVEPARLTGGSVAGRMREAVPLAASHRAHSPEPYDVPDPYGRSLETYQAVFTQIRQNLDIVSASFAEPAR